MADVPSQSNTERLVERWSAIILAGWEKSKNRNATHPVNAMLNYGYAVAVGQLKIQALAEGYDPTIGIMHHDYRDGPACALDLVEPVRPMVDRAVLKLALSNEMHPGDFTIRGDGACRLNPQMARRIVQLGMNAIPPGALVHLSLD